MALHPASHNILMNVKLCSVPFKFWAYVAYVGSIDKKHKDVEYLDISIFPFDMLTYIGTCVFYILSTNVDGVTKWEVTTLSKSATIEDLSRMKLMFMFSLFISILLVTLVYQSREGCFQYF